MLSVNYIDNNVVTNDRKTFIRGPSKKFWEGSDRVRVGGRNEKLQWSDVSKLKTPVPYTVSFFPVSLFCRSDDLSPPFPWVQLEGTEYLVEKGYPRSKTGRPT